MNKQMLFTVAAILVAVGATSAFFVLNRPRSADATPILTSPGDARTNDSVRRNEPIQPLQKVSLDAGKVSLGRQLFNDVRLSADNSISCNSCHNLNNGGADGRVHSIGIGGMEGDINSPTVFNSSLNMKQFWDGRADSLESQVDGPTHNPKEMGSNWNEIVGKLTADPVYTKSFAKSYSDGLTASNIKDAIANFERSLVTTDSRFDKYLRGDEGALTDQEKAGYQEFKSIGCVSCHQGLNAGGNMFQPFGVMGDYFAKRGNETKADLGRFNVTGKPQDKHRFRVPGLRNVELTAPYFHDGSAKTLDEAVRVMVEYQIGQTISDTQISNIVAFLKSLTGEQPK
jgi:cytochrome c peroxidase